VSDDATELYDGSTFRRTLEMFPDRTPIAHGFEMRHLHLLGDERGNYAIMAAQADDPVIARFAREREQLYDDLVRLITALDPGAVERWIASR
jgi:hypothetical protein